MKNYWKLLLCWVAWSALCAAAQETAAPPPATVASETPPDAAKPAGSKKKTAAKTAHAEVPAVPLAPDLQAAHSLVIALGAAIDAGGADPEVVGPLRKQQAELQSKLGSGADATAISRQALDLLESLYRQPVPVAPPQAQPKPDSNLPTPWQPWALAILVAVLSPAICVVGFWFGSKNAERTLRNSLREAGLL